MDQAEADKTLDLIDQEIHSFSELMQEVPEVHDVLTVPLYPKTFRLDVMRQLADQLKLSELSRRFLGLLLEKRRIEFVPQIAESYREILDSRRGIVHATVWSAQPLDPGTAKSLGEVLARRLGKEVKVSAEVDPTLIAGIRTQIGSVVIDGTVRGRLEGLRESLKGE